MNIINHLLWLLVVLSSGGSFIFTREPMIIGIVILSLASTKGSIKTSLKHTLIFTLVLIVISIFQSGGLGKELYIRLANFAAALSMLNFILFNGLEKVLKSLRNILLPMPIIAILTFILANSFPNLFTDIDVNGNGAWYKTIGLIFTYHQMLDTTLARPDGLFYEPGVFQIYLNILLFLSLNVYRNYVIAIISVISIATLQSTTGYFVLVVVAIHHLYTVIYRGQSNIKRTLNVALGLSIVVALLVFSKDNFQSKFYGDSKGSFLARQYDFVFGLDMVRTKPLIGHGFSYQNYKDHSYGNGALGDMLDETFSSTRETTSNGILFLFIAVGIPLGIIFIKALFTSVLFKNNLLFGTMVFSTLLSEMLVFTPFFLVIMYSGLIIKNKSKVGHVSI